MGASVDASFKPTGNASNCPSGTTQDPQFGCKFVSNNIPCLPVGTPVPPGTLSVSFCDETSQGVQPTVSTGSMVGIEIALVVAGAVAIGLTAWFLIKK